MKETTEIDSDDKNLFVSRCNCCFIWLDKYNQR